MISTCAPELAASTSYILAITSMWKRRSPSKASSTNGILPLTFISPDASSGVLDTKIQADSVETGSRMKNNKLKGKNFST